jgi:hypothetical protein
VGFGTSSCLSGDLGLLPDVNAVYGVHELSVYDPIIPRAYYESWTAATGQAAGIPSFNLFCPAVTSAAVARQYGVAFVLEPPGARGPAGAVFDRRVGDESLYRIPDAAAATLVPVAPSGPAGSDDASGTPVAVTHPDPATWRLVTASASPQQLRLRLTSVPGWHATIDGRALPLESVSGVMLQARVPAGSHTLRLTYWPRAFTIGIVLAGCGAIALAVGLLVSGARRRRPAGSVDRGATATELAVAPTSPSGKQGATTFSVAAREVE